MIAYPNVINCTEQYAKSRNLLEIVKMLVQLGYFAWLSWSKLHNGLMHLISICATLAAYNMVGEVSVPSRDKELSE
jgi:hypothetical protein